ncbi:hypothetical protein BKA67DRAFT_556838 [Truncatella angustata]|uniref:Uncharacterized protein n=1 Tax=Truncatella angustata TaxID=152316 RepID=A0A9P8US19_9PEZI|nr:uncharacterized protein BKA67DRAFT_556838 [Truncatella angustata]KAH6657970.1 hypothetical protein BKA67DRAFT_556838 [Truncatella angustata]KAH8198812.1 hypothetical protein TruAng_007035 [Truncatella angustata]
MASTRSTTGNSRPRVHLTVDSGPERKHTKSSTTTKRGRKPGSTNATTSAASKPTGVKKRGRPAGSTAAATTTKAPATHHKRKSHLSDKIEGVADKIVGTVTRNPGKKAAGTKKIRGTDGKNARGRPRKSV